MIELPNINYGVISVLFGFVVVALGTFWSIHKAIIIAKSH